MICMSIMYVHKYIMCAWNIEAAAVMSLNLAKKGVEGIIYLILCERCFFSTLH